MAASPKALRASDSAFSAAVSVGNPRRLCWRRLPSSPGGRSMTKYQSVLVEVWYEPTVIGHSRGHRAELTLSTVCRSVTTPVTTRSTRAILIERRLCIEKAADQDFRPRQRPEKAGRADRI